MGFGSSIVAGLAGVFVRTLLLLAGLAAAGDVSAQSALLPAAPAMHECRAVTQGLSGFLQQCGDRLYAWSLTLPALSKRSAGMDLHGRFSFECPIELMCDGEPSIVWRFVEREDWLSSPMDEAAIFERTSGFWVPTRPPQPAPAADCPLFDVSIGEASGRATCFKSGANSIIFAVAADDRVGFVMSFYQRDTSTVALKEKILQLLPLFRIERATGDAALMKWFR